MSDRTTVRRLVAGLQAKLGADVLRTASKGLLLLVLTRYLLTPEEFGLLFFGMSALAVAQLGANLGFAKSTARYVSDYSQTDESQIRHVVRAGLLYNLTTVAIVGAVLVGFDREIAVLLDEPALAPLLVLGPLFVLFTSLRTFTRTVFQGFNEVWWSALVSTVSSVTQFALVVGLVVLDYGVVGAFAGYIGAAALASIVGFAVLYRRFYSRLPEAESTEDGLKRRVLRYNFPLAATRGAGVLTGKVDQLLIGFFLTPAAVGFYTLGKQISEFVMMPAVSLGFVISPAYSSEQTGDRPERASRIYEKSFENIVLLYVPAACGLALVAEPTIRLIVGSDYLGAVPVVQILSVFIVVKAVDKITNDGLDYLGRARARAVIKSLGAVSNFALNVALIPVMGVAGAAVATVLTTSGVVAVNVYLVTQELDLSPWHLGATTVRVAAITAVMGGVVWVALPFVSGIPSLLAVVTAGAVVWAVLALLGGFVDLDDVETVLANVV
ncbi:polysaccharide biosynthesis protein [Halosimplex carlsbadense 2-9-1]|uniref:Polysaccharide biosynthesis protein n=1 Tax=Halosimplex carlsbadense 2-9-1 TaxID=797114 RepID=M0CIK4_9EURY|nr:flippase [Halosimplex carlsbadense]ELZ23110.1 polysaccharide biosynthesis protein [Halosimplex carlsbadense 2-9-1]